MELEREENDTRPRRTECCRGMENEEGKEILVGACDASKNASESFNVKSFKKVSLLADSVMNRIN